ncbi:MAG: M20/M25/M40 family metallo-hydrolase, partial [Bacteroidales bacterium]|nr:M20/M25/M40 family metallo-hydrolase [Bacteroidales bacterium]
MLRKESDLQRLGNEPIMNYNFSTVKPITKLLLVIVFLLFYQSSTHSQDHVADVISSITKEHVTTDLKKITGELPIEVGGKQEVLDNRSRYNTFPTLKKAIEYAHEQLTAYGFDTYYHHAKDYKYEGDNVIGEKKGTKYPKEIVLLTAHIDTRPITDYSPGANDNGTGVVTLLSVARAIKNMSFERTIRIVFFDMEETAMVGSSMYVFDFENQLKKNVVRAMNVDMIGWDGNGDNVLHVHTRKGNPRETKFGNEFKQVVDNYGLNNELDVIIKNIGRDASDHRFFWKKNIPMVALQEDRIDERYPHTHKQTDTWDKLDMEYFTAAVKAVAGTMVVWGNATGGSTISLADITDLKATAKNCSTVALTWTDKSAGEDGFIVRRKEQGGVFTTLTNAAANVQKYNDNSVVEGKTYVYQVRPFQGTNKKTSNQPLVKVTACSGAGNDINDITDLSLTASNCSTVVLNWTDNSTGEDGFRIRRKTLGAKYVTLEDIQANSEKYTDATVVENTTYVYMVRPLKDGVAVKKSNTP